MIACEIEWLVESVSNSSLYTVAIAAAGCLLQQSVRRQPLMHHTETSARRIVIVDGRAGQRPRPAAGETFGLVGPDGAGKTTTIQMLTDVLPPTADEIRVAGVDVMQNADALDGRIGYMSEGFTLYDSLNVEENLKYFT